MQQNRSAINSILDKDTKSLPGIIGAFRNGRTDQVGYDDPTYFGFAIDIHSQQAEASTMYNPYTGLRSSPLFYMPEWQNANLDYASGIMTKNTAGDTFPELMDASEACAIQYLNSFSLDLDDTKDEFEPTQVKLNSAANVLAKAKRPTGAKLNRGFYLMQFIKLINDIQDKTPWVFKEIDGISNLWKASQPGTELTAVELTITCDETVDLRITRLAETYRMLSYDSFNNRKLLPNNLEKFSMDLYYMDLRFLKNATNTTASSAIGGSGVAEYDKNFSAQVNFGGIAFRCMGCRFDFSNLLESSSAVKASLGDSGNFQPKFKIIIDRVLPSSYFGDMAFGTRALTEDTIMPGEENSGNALGGALNLGPFTGGVNRILSAGRRALTNILGAPQRKLNDALLGIQQRFEGAIDDFLGDSPALSSRPFDKWSPTDLEAVQKERGTIPINDDVYVGSQLTILTQRKVGGKINTDAFPGKDTRTAIPIKTDVFPGKDNRTKLPINTDVFPGESTIPSVKNKIDVFPGDVPLMDTLNQRKSGGKITSQNPLKR